MTGPGDSSALGTRVPCPHCDTMILAGARKCRGCRRWLDPGQRSIRRWRLAGLVSGIVFSLGLALVVSRPSPVGVAPPLTPLPAGADEAVAPVAQEGAAPAPEITDVERPLLLDDDVDTPVPWHRTDIKIDVRPLDVIFSADGASVYVSGDDATVRAYDVATGRLRHMLTVPAQGDRLVLLYDRYVAVVHRGEASHIPIVDTEHWDREPTLLWVGSKPADIVPLGDGKTVLTASSRGKRLSWWDLETKRRRANIKLPHRTEKLHTFDLDGRVYIGAMGSLRRGGRHTGSWIDLFDPSEIPFAATRRSIAVGREPNGHVGLDRRHLIVADRAANRVSLYDLQGTTPPRSVRVGSAPMAAYLMRQDRYGVTLDADSNTATIVDAATMKRRTTLMLPDTPRDGALSADRKRLFVIFGGDAWPPRGTGAVILGGDPPQIMQRLETGRGVTRVAAREDGLGAAIIAYRDRLVTVLIPRTERLD